ncbi:hypothetical protein Poli38472_004796 [Pythium oligandrum]|uniref:FZ domain-containing protein n=1 Tax=Pythium oligandrum TaxID=41045 RepID=A0A8K1CCB1_PYTOL|nr:hypothetical protein Poli38472_004796 [Pythium oligandrum]|eukprot:TMW59727.1 hypothetical protein Poli38472_004796 [Pythium oligandrum]
MRWWRVVAVAAGCRGVEAVVGDVDLGRCAVCQGLQYCTAMNGKLLFDPVRGYTREKTTQLKKQGVCEDLDAKTLTLSQFGDQYQFKNTPRCQQLVWNFHCLSWVATTFQRVINGVNISCANVQDASTVPLPPCRSLCVEVADKCVYSHFYRPYLENVCGRIPCVREDDELASNGTIKQQPCIPGAWEKAPNTTFSRCSIRAYEPPKAAATAVYHSQLVFLLAMACLLYHNAL